MFNIFSGFDISRRRSDGWGMHSDWAYYKAQDYPQTIISSAICLDDCTAENGPLHIWPGTHKEHLPHQQSEHGGLIVEPGSIDSAGGIDLIVPAGTVLLFSSLLIHNSRPNTSGNPRRLMIYSHSPQTPIWASTYATARPGCAKRPTSGNISACGNGARRWPHSMHRHIKTICNQ